MFTTTAPALLPALALKPEATEANSFNDANPPAVGTEFGLEQSVLSASPSGLHADTSVALNAATLTYTGGENFRLSIPGRNVDLVFAASDLNKTTSDGASVTLSVGTTDYVLAGAWVHSTADLLGISTFISGYLAPLSAIPFSGTAVYSRVGGVGGVLHVVSGGTYDAAQIAGDASLTVNFSTASITGTFSNMTVENLSHEIFAWNSVGITAGFSSGTLTGTTLAGVGPANPYAMTTTASGFFKGQFYGPGATEIGALWSLYDGTKTAVGALSVSGSPPPSPPPVVVPQPVMASDAVLAFLDPNPQSPVSVTSNPPVIAAPAAASAGGAPAPALIAASGGPSLDGAVSFPANGTAFPLTQSVMQLSSAGLTADNAANSGGATIVIGPFGASGGFMDFHLNIPSLGISQYIQTFSGLSDTFAGGTSGSANGYVAAIGLSYTSFGRWVANTTGPSAQADVAAFVMGYETPVAAMPTSGTATYSGTGNVLGNVFVPGKFGATAPAVSGDASFSANFATGEVTGTFTNMKAYDHANALNPAETFSYPWNDVSVSASIAAGTTKFSGTTTATSQPVSPYALGSGAAGHIDGGFYGPNAENLGAVWSLSNADGSGSALGVVGAAKQ